MRISLQLLCASLALASFNAPAQMMAGGKPGQVILDELRRGGYVLYMRHAQADVGSDATDDPAFLADCGKQRRLNDAGRESARKVGETMRSLKIPVQRIYTGELCRAKETGELLALGPVETTPDLNDAALWKLRGRDPATYRSRNEALLTAMPPAGANVVLVSHMQKGSNAVSPMLDLLEPGTVAVFKPSGGHGELVAVIRAADWTHLGVSELPLK